MSTLELFLLVGGTLFFLVIGSLVNVIIDRLPKMLDAPNEYGEVWDTRPWREVLGGRSRCSDCGTQVRAIDNIPIVSWLVLRGRCRECGARIPMFHLWVELAHPVLFLVAVSAFGLTDWRILVVLWLIPAGLAISVIDLRTMIVPTRIIWPSFFVAVALAVAVSALEGEWGWLLTAAIGVLVLAGPLFVIWFIHPKGMGFGDVRLTVLLGWTVGFSAGVRPWAAVVLALLTLTLASILGIVMGVVAMGARGRKAQVPFGPSLALAAFICACFAEPILEPFGVYALV